MDFLGQKHYTHVAAFSLRENVLSCEEEGIGSQHMDSETPPHGSFPLADLAGVFTVVAVVNLSHEDIC